MAEENRRRMPSVGIRSLRVRRLLQPVLVAQWHKPRLTQINERPAEYSFALSSLGKTCPASVLDVGTGLSSWPHTLTDCGFRVTAMDNISAYWDHAVFNRHYHIVNDDITAPSISERFDFITCISVLEHVSNHQDAIDGIFSLLNDGGHAVLTFPYNDSRYVPNVYELEEAGYGKEAAYICQVFSRQEVEGWMERVGASVVDEEYYRIFSGELWTFGQRLNPIELSSREGPHHLACLLVRKA